LEQGGGAIGSAAGTAAFLNGASSSNIPILGAAGAILGAGVSKITEDTTYLCATDIQIVEKTKELVTQTITDNTALGNGQPSSAGGILGALFGGGQPSLSPPPTLETPNNKSWKPKKAMNASIKPVLSPKPKKCGWISMMPPSPWQEVLSKALRTSSPNPSTSKGGLSWATLPPH